MIDILFVLDGLCEVVLGIKQYDLNPYFILFLYFVCLFVCLKVGGWISVGTVNNRGKASILDPLRRTCGSTDLS